MLPTGHIAGGYLASLGAARALGVNIPDLAEPAFIAMGVFMAFAPDLDMFYSFYRKRRLYLDEESSRPGINHRHYVSHAPLLHLVISAFIVLVGIFLDSGGIQAAGVMWLFGTWSHFFLDSFGYGITWLWLFSDRVYSLYNTGDKISVPGTSFFQYWIDFLKSYIKRPEFYLEILVIVIAVYVYFQQ